MAQKSDIQLKPRPPIVVVVGHVDHGKTSLLDYIRKTNVVAREAGGITQAVGAYEIDVKAPTPAQAGSGSRPQASGKITFIDTPGHEAFTQMRCRGCDVADLAILVVAADEGVKPQTQESIKILNDAKTPFIVAITKVDKSGADLDKVKNDLTAAGVLLEGYGGHVSYESISSKSGAGIPELLDLVLLAAELENLTYDPSLPAEGFVLESRMDRRRGNEASVIVKNGTLRFGDEIATPSARGKVKILENFLGESAKTLEPSSPAVIVGFESLPQVGERFAAGAGAASVATTNGNGTKQQAQTERPENSLNIILKAKDGGSLEALSQIIRSMTLAGRPPHIVAETVGDVVDNDVKLAISTKAVIASFAGRVDKAAKTLAEANAVTILSADVIYHLVKAMEDYAAAGHVDAEGILDVLAVFNEARLNKQVIGGKVIEGVLKIRAAFEMERAGVVVGRGRVVNLQAQKEDVSQVSVGSECGLLVNASVTVQKGDKLVVKA
ncbi:MAG: translation initiation factor translation initiation factor [Candidatus Parcubacteria bacterium]|jgi:translation initiation factor IF-2